MIGFAALEGKVGRLKMSRSYAIESISPATIDRTYLLARAAMPGLLAHEWRQFCRGHDPSRIRATADDREEIALARNATGYVKGLCVYAVRTHPTYGRLLDVPFFVVASAADGEGVAAELLDFLRDKCDKFVCSGIRFWTMSPNEAWAGRLSPRHIARSDHGLFMPALASAAEIEQALLAHGVGAAEAIDRLSR
jgi:hypothetical protein